MFLDFQSNMDIKAFDMISLEIIAILFRKTVFMHTFISCNRLERLVITGNELDSERQSTLDALVEEFVQQNSGSFNFEFPIKEIHLFKTKRGAFTALISFPTRQLIEHMQASVISSIMESINDHINKSSRKVKVAEPTQQQPLRIQNQDMIDLDDVYTNTFNQLHKKDAYYNQYDDISSLYVKSLKNIRSTGVLNFQKPKAA